MIRRAWGFGAPAFSFALFGLGGVVLPLLVFPLPFQTGPIGRTSFVEVLMAVGHVVLGAMILVKGLQSCA